MPMLAVIGRATEVIVIEAIAVRIFSATACAPANFAAIGSLTEPSMRSERARTPDPKTIDTYAGVL